MHGKIRFHFGRLQLESDPKSELGDTAGPDGGHTKVVGGSTSMRCMGKSISTLGDSSNLVVEPGGQELKEREEVVGGLASMRSDRDKHIQAYNHTCLLKKCPTATIQKTW